MSCTSKKNAVTTLVTCNSSYEKLMDLNFLKYFAEIKQELSLLSATYLNFNEKKIKFGVKDAFYGLHFYNRLTKFEEPKSLLFAPLLASLVAKVS